MSACGCVGEDGTPYGVQGRMMTVNHRSQGGRVESQENKVRERRATRVPVLFAQQQGSKVVKLRASAQDCYFDYFRIEACRETDQ